MKEPLFSKSDWAIYEFNCGMRLPAPPSVGTGAGQAGVVECGIEIDEDKIVIYSFINSRFVCNRPLCLFAEQDSGQDSNSYL